MCPAKGAAGAKIKGRSVQEAAIEATLDYVREKWLQVTVGSLDILHS